MKKLNSLPLLLMMVALLSVASRAQSVMQNEDVIGLVKSGLSEAIITAKIKASEAKFDVSAPALKALTEAKVPDSVVVAMLEKDQKQREEANASRKDSDKSLSSIPEQGSLSDLNGAKRVYIMTDNAKSRDIIAKELNKIKLFDVVEKIEDSDFVLKYEESVEELGATGSVYGNTANVRRVSQKVGLMNAAMLSADGKRIRRLYTVRKTKYFVWEDNSAESTTQQFIKDFGRVRKQ